MAHLDSRESRALRRSYGVFKTGLDPDTIITALYSKLLLTPEERGKATQRTLTPSQQLEEVFVCLERRISIDPKVFHELVQVLLEEPALEVVGKKMQAHYHEEQSLLTSSDTTSSPPKTCVQLPASSNPARQSLLATSIPFEQPEQHTHHSPSVVLQPGPTPSHDLLRAPGTTTGPTKTEIALAIVNQAVRALESGDTSLGCKLFGDVEEHGISIIKETNDLIDRVSSVEKCFREQERAKAIEIGDLYCKEQIAEHRRAQAEQDLTSAEEERRRVRRAQRGAYQDTNKASQLEREMVQYKQEIHDFDNEITVLSQKQDKIHAERGEIRNSITRLRDVLNFWKEFFQQMEHAMKRASVLQRLLAQLKVQNRHTPTLSGQVQSCVSAWKSIEKKLERINEFLLSIDFTSHRCSFCT